MTWLHSSPLSRLLTVALAGLGSLALRAAEPALTPVVIQLPYQHQFQFAGIYAAVAQGYFRQAGLAVELRSTSSEHLNPLVEVAKGFAQFGIHQGPNLVARRLEGADIVVLAAIMQHSPQVIVARADAGIHTPHDLIGKTVALDQTALVSEVRVMLEREGVTMDKIHVVPNRWDVDELQTRTADAMSTFVIDGPFEEEQAGIKVSIIRPVDYGVDFYGDCLFTSSAMLKEHPELVAAVRKAVLQGWDYALQHQDEMVRLILTKYGPGRPSLTRAGLQSEARQVARLINADLVGIGHMNEGRWQAMAEIVHQQNPEADPARLAGFIYQPQESESGRFQWVLRNLWWGLSAAVAVALLAVLTSWRLRRLVERRTRELVESERRQREIFDLAPAPIVVENYAALEPELERLRREGVTDLRAHLLADPVLLRRLHTLKRVVAANRLTLSRNGFRSVEDMDQRLPEIMTDQGYQNFAEELVAIWTGNDRLMLETSYTSKAGETLYTLLNWEVGRLPDGRRDLANVRLVFTEITELRRAERALRESESRYRELFENAIGGVYRSGPDGRFIAVNPALVRMLGFSSADELIKYDSRQSGQPFYVQPGRGEEFLNRRRNDGYVANFESEVRRKDGSRIWISENVRVVCDRSGNELYHEGFVSDITMNRRLDLEMQRASKLEAVGILAGGIAHDFNNILTAVLGNITLAEMDAGTEAPGARLLREAKRATLRARDLTQQLLTFAKGGEPVRAAMDLPEMLRETVDFALHGAKVRADYQIAADLWPVNADKGQLGQVVQNLTINSIQAMPNGGRLTLCAENVRRGESVDGIALPAGRYVVLTVSDEGVGIAPDYLAKIFDPYFTTKQQGSGLGLATVYSIIRKHQGHIEVESQLGKGTKFRMWLPAADTAVVETAEKKPASVLLHKRVLFMDDEVPIREMAEMFMRRLEVDCELAADGHEAVRKFEAARLEHRPFDVVLVDLTVPGGMGGKEALDLIRKIDPAVRAIVSSGYSQSPVLANYREHGFQGILPKPYDLDQLRQVLEQTSAPPQ